MSQVIAYAFPRLPTLTLRWRDYTGEGLSSDLYNNQINARALIGQSAVGYCAGKPTEKSRVFWIIIQKQ